MKIIKLTMNAFMTYKETTTIDFDEMVAHGLYLISGPTGAGKTTLFDAVTFALYGCASGTHRQRSHLRSDFADEKEETYVELTFQLHNHTYIVKRSPAYQRVGYKTLKAAQASFYDGEKWIEGVKDVDQKVISLLGVDVHQFKQVVMIAQGEFTKLIYANSEEREKVLRHIFQSDTLRVFENLLKEATKAYKEEYQKRQQERLTHFQLLHFSKEFHACHQDFHPSYLEDAVIENETLHQQLQKQKLNYEMAQEHYHQLHKQYYQKESQNQAIHAYQALQDQYQDLMSQESQMQAYNDDIEMMRYLETHQAFLYDYRKTQAEHRQQEEQLSQVRKKEEHYLETDQAIKQDYARLPQLRAEKDEALLQVDKMKQATQKQADYQQKQLLLHQVQQALEIAHQEYAEKCHAYERLQKRVERDQENVKRLPQLEHELYTSEQQAKELNNQRIFIHELRDSYDQLLEAQDKHFELKKTYEKVMKTYETLTKRYYQEDENMKRQHAGILAKNLQEHEPCPVCGSREHPQLASIDVAVMSEEELKALREELKRCEQEKDACYQDVLAQYHKIQDIQATIQVSQKHLQLTEELSKEVFIRLLADITRVVAQEEKTYDKRREEVIYLKKIIVGLEKDQKQLTQQSEELEKITRHIHEQEMQVAVMKSEQVDIEKHYPMLLLSTLQEDYLHILKTYQEYEKQIQMIDTRYHQHCQELEVITQTKKALMQQHKSLSFTWEKLQKQHEDFIQEFFQSRENFEKYVEMLPQKKEKEELYQNYVIQKNTIAKQLQSTKAALSCLTLINLDKEQDKLKQQEEQCQRELTQYNTQCQTYEHNQKIIHTLQNDDKKNGEMFKTYTLYKELSDMASGQNMQKLSFERYVLSTYFEFILEHANVELLKMSQGRYAMYRKVDVKGAKQQGLELSVLDYETGVIRDIQSLSGGESFQAALALALGLSTMIQSYAGGIELNTLFIDEGFGTLDHESIDQALSVLLDLKNDNKVIGIISHVDELKERIPTQLIIEKEQHGSSIHIEKA